MRGWLVYEKEDYQKNSDFADWLISELAKRDLQTEILLREELFKRKEGLSCDFAINRTRDYNLSLTFELNEIPVFNSSEITLLGNNKFAGYRYAKAKGFPFADILLFPDLERKVIAKPVYGHGGEGIHLYEGGESKKDYLYQELVEDYLGDVRFYIVGNEIIHAVLRKKSREKLCSNFSQGNDFEIFHYSIDVEKQVKNFLSELNIDYAGADFLLMRNGSLLFNEIEDVVGSRMLSALGMNDTAPRFAERIARKLKKES